MENLEFKILEVQRKDLMIMEIQQISIAKISSMSTPSLQIPKLLLHYIEMERSSLHLMGSKITQALSRSMTPPKNHNIIRIQSASW